LTTSKSFGDPGLLKEIDLIMNYYKFDIVHCNNGLHGFDYTEAEYKKAFPAFIKTIRTKTDMTVFDPKTERIKVRS
jgi:hypothetical protein